MPTRWSVRGCGCGRAALTVFELPETLPAGSGIVNARTVLPHAIAMAYARSIPVATSHSCSALSASRA